MDGLNGKASRSTRRMNCMAARATGELQRSPPGISKKMLTQTQREMERDVLISHRV